MPAAPPPSLDGTPATPVAGTAGVSPSPTAGVASRIGEQQAAAQATIGAFATREAAQATRIARLEAALVDAQVTVTALAVEAASAVLDPTRQTIAVQTDLGGMLGNDQAALDEARLALSTRLARYPIGCRAGFVLISGKAFSIEGGVQLARRTDDLLREFWPDIFGEATGVEVFALPNEPPFGEVAIDIFFYSGCQPIG